MLLNTIFDVCEVKRDALSFWIVYCRLNMPKQRTRFFLYPFAGGEQHVGETCGDICIITVYVARKADSNAPGLLDRCFFCVVLFIFTVVAVAVFVMVMMFMAVMIVIMATHCIIS